MRVLCNLPLEAYEDRDQLGCELVTYGPACGMSMAGTRYAFDVEFDPSEETTAELWERLPADFVPDVWLFYRPDQEPLPEGMEDSPVPVVGILSDYNLSLQHVMGLWPFFDMLLVDRAGVDLFQRLPFSDVRYFCQYTFKRPYHHLLPGVPRDLDLAFIGNLNPVVQQERAPWIHRLRGLGNGQRKVVVETGIQGLAYGRVLNRARVGFNRSIRGEMNLRSFEVPACGAVLFMERENLEVRDFLEPEEEVVLYGDDDFEDRLDGILGDERRRARIGRAGHHRIQQYSMGQQLQELFRLLETPGPGRPAATRLDRCLGRGIALLSTWARGPGVSRPLVEALHLDPNDPRPLNGLALGALLTRGAEAAPAAMLFLRRALALDSSYVPAAANLLWMLERSDRPELVDRTRRELQRRLDASPSWRALEGPVLPLGFSAAPVRHSAVLQEAVRHGDRAILGRSLAPMEDSIATTADCTGHDGP